MFQHAEALFIRCYNRFVSGLLSLQSPQFNLVEPLTESVTPKEPGSTSSRQQLSGEDLPTTDQRQSLSFLIM